MRTPLVLGLALLSLPAAAADPMAFLSNGAGSVTVEGVVEVPLLRGVDTNGRPAILATGPAKGDADPEEFLLSISLSEGPNKCTEGVVGNLGGWTQEVTVARQGSLFGKVTKTGTKIANIPEMSIGGVVFKDVHCEVDAKSNVLAVPQFDEIAVAVLASEGVVKFTAADNAASLLDAVGNTKAALSSTPTIAWSHGRKIAVLGKSMLTTVDLFGEPASVALSYDRSSMVARDFSAIPWTAQRSGLLYTAGTAQAESDALPTSDYIVFDGIIGKIYHDGGPDYTVVDAVLGNDVLYAADVAVDPAGGKIALARAETVKWTDPGEKLLEEAREAFDEAGDGSASLLQPLPALDFALAAVDLEPETCVQHVVVEKPNKANSAGVRTFGAAKVTLKEIPCDTGVARASEDDASADAAEGEGDSKASKEADRQANWGDALWKHGRYADAYAAYGTAFEQAGDDCSYGLDYAEKSFAMGEVDTALAAATRSGELYGPWAAKPLAERLENAADAQADDCYRAYGLRAAALLARGSHAKVEAVYDKHMDLDEDLAHVVALSRLAKGRPDLAHGALLQAMNVGGRGDPSIHATLGLTGARMDRDRIAEANLDRMFAIEAPWTLQDALVAVAVAREIGGADRVEAFTTRLVEQRPGSAVAWTVHGLEAARRGDTATLDAVKARAAELSQAAIDRTAGSSDGYAEAAGLRAVAGESAAAKRDLDISGNTGGSSVSLGAARAVAAAMSHDSTAVDAELQNLARRAPMHALGTLKLLTALPKPAAAPK